ncbi:MAG: GNAT family N-acetyltransferase [Gemmatimonadaceae bacterium]
MPFELITPRLVLQEMTLDDLDFVAAMLGDVEVMRHYPKVLSREDSAVWIQRQLDRYVRDGTGLWIVRQRGSLVPVGQVGLLQQDVDGEWHPEIGYLLHRPFWHLGLAREAAEAVRDYAFRVRGCGHVISMIRPENVPSQGVARHLGMTPVHRLQWRGFVHDVWRVDAPEGSQGETGS